MKNIVSILLAVMLVFGMVACSNSNPFTDPSSPVGPTSPVGPLNPNNPDSPLYQDKFTSEEAYAAADSLVDGLDKAKIMQVFANKIEGTANESLKLGENLTIVLNNGEKKEYPTDMTGLSSLWNDIRPSAPETDPAYTVDEINYMTIDMIFTDFKDGFKGNTGLESITGTLSAKIIPTSFSDGVTALVEVSGTGIEFTVNGETFTVDVSGFPLMAKMEGSNVSGSLPEKTSTESFRVKKDGTTQTIAWNKLSETLDPDTAWYNGDIKEDLKNSFYMHFGTNRLLNALYSAFNSDAKDSKNGLKIGEVVTANNTVTIPLTLTNYGYNKNGAAQTVNGTATMIFNLEADGKTSKDGTVKDINLVLSDSNENFSSMTINEDSVSFTVADSIEFVVTDTDVTGIIDYRGENYDASKNEITFEI